MTKDDMEIVSALHSQLADRVGWKRFDLWFGNGTRLTINDATLIVETPGQFYQDWLRTHFRRDLEQVASQVLGRPVSVEFRINEQLTPESAPHIGNAAMIAADALAGKTTSASITATSAPVGSNAIPQTIKFPQASQGPELAVSDSQPCRRRPLATFDDFVVGSSNKVAFTSAQNIIERPGIVSPLVIHGRTGVGKSHLLQSIYIAATRGPRKLHAVSLSAEQFTTDFLEALGGKGLPSFRRKYRGVDLLLIDDVQFFIGKRATLVELQYTIETLQREGKQLVFSSDRAPQELVELGPELTARLSGGLVCRIDAPDFGTRLGIVGSLARRHGLEVPGEVQSLLALHVGGGAREIAGALYRLEATSMAHEQPISRALADQIVAELRVENNRVVQLPDIERAVCDVFNLLPDSLQSSRKSKAVGHPRMLAMFLARKYTRAALSEIGQFFGRRSHSTVISASKKIESHLNAGKPLAIAQQDWDVEDAIRRIEQRLKVG